MNAQILRNTEKEIEQLWNEGELPYLTHLAGGNENWLVDFFAENVKPTDWICASHRAHFHWMLHYGMQIASDGKENGPLLAHISLIEKVKRGKSMFLYGPRFIQSAIVAGTCAIAVGLAKGAVLRGTGERVFCFVGVGAEDEGHFYEAVRHVHATKLPCNFIIEDNNGSCGVTKEQRGSPDDWQWPDCVIRHRYTLAWPHAGSGKPMVLKK